jgi:prevent-host-death family protein
MIHLRVGVPMNGQQAGINMAQKFELGAVAQLGRACGWQPQGRGFESPQLHSLDCAPHAVGAETLRLRLGTYMERAHAGERFLVTRRGKPYVRLMPADDQLTPA